jgi:hypothetical protein
MSSTGLRKSSIFALERTSYHAGTWWFAPIAGVIAAVIFYLMGRPMPFADWLPDNAPLRTAYEILFSIFAAYVFVFSLWLCWSPLHFRFETRGGFRKVAWNKTRNLRVEGWHLIVSGGIGAGFFLIIMIVGIIWHVILPPKAADARSSASTATIKSEPMNPEPEPLPKGRQIQDRQSYILARTTRIHLKRSGGDFGCGRRFRQLSIGQNDTGSYDSSGVCELHS